MMTRIFFKLSRERKKGFLAFRLSSSMPRRSPSWPATAPTPGRCWLWRSPPRDGAEKRTFLVVVVVVMAADCRLPASLW